MYLKKMIILILGVVGTAFGASLTLKAAIGVGAWDSLAQAGNYITNIPVGTVGMVFNFTCIFIQIVILKSKFKKLQLLQIVVSIILGTMVNFFVYDVLGMLTISSYVMNIVLLVVGYVVCSFAVGLVMTLDVVTFALEGACMSITHVVDKPFAVLRQYVDIISIVIVLGASFLLDVPLAIREGTIIGMLIFAPMMGVFMKIQKPILQKMDVID